MTEQNRTDLFKYLHNMIENNGDLTVGQFMSLCLGHPQFGYYMTQKAFGAEGDFTTAPEISQTFGEMIALWVITQWEQMGKPDMLQLVELGPGRGTLMKDLWRGLSAKPELRDLLHVHLVEFSPRLRAEQSDNLAGVPVTWHDNIETLPYLPSLIIANEFFDALPIEQAVRHQDHWYQRVVTASEEDLLFSLGKPLQGIAAHRDVTDGTIYEYAPIAAEMMQDLCRRLYDSTGAMLVIDYGDDIALDERFGDTLQALYKHQPVDVFAHIGTSDITSHVAFRSLALVAQENLCATLPVQTQGEFLKSFGIELRLKALLENASPEQAATLQSGVKRLIADDEMGSLFKVLQVFCYDN